MSMASFYLQKVDQCARLADDAEPRERARFRSERYAWLRSLAREIGADDAILEAAIALLPIDGK
jgi:hypothetical protein